jgi:hypothetical protein
MTTTIPEAWVQIQEESAARTEQGEGWVGFVPAMGRLLLAHPRIGPQFRALYREVMWGDGALSRQECELVAAVTASAQDCTY